MDANLKSIIKLNLPSDILEKSILVSSNEKVGWIPVLQYESNISMGVLENGDWVVEGKYGLYTLIETQSYLYAMILLEHPLNEICERVIEFFYKYHIEIDIYDSFPIVHIIKAGFEQGSEYWANLAFKWYELVPVEMKKKLKNVLEKLSDAKWASQQLRHKAKREVRLMYHNKIEE